MDNGLLSIIFLSIYNPPIETNVDKALRLLKYLSLPSIYQNKFHKFRLKKHYS